MKFIELHDETDTFWVNIDTIETIERGTLTTKPYLSSFIMVNGYGHHCKETPEEIFQKIAEAEQRDTVPTGFMDDWEKEVEDQLSRLTVRKDGSGE